MVIHCMLFYHISIKFQVIHLFLVFFLLLHPSYLQLISIHALISFSHVVSSYLIIGKKKLKKNIYKKNKKFFLLILVKKIFIVIKKTSLYRLKKLLYSD